METFFKRTKLAGTCNGLGQRFGQYGYTRKGVPFRSDPLQSRQLKVDPSRRCTLNWVQGDPVCRKGSLVNLKEGGLAENARSSLPQGRIQCLLRDRL